MASDRYGIETVAGDAAAGAGPDSIIGWVASQMYLGIHPDMIFIGLYAVPIFLVVMVAVCNLLGRLMPQSAVGRLRQRLREVANLAAENEASLDMRRKVIAAKRQAARN